ncbi:hypothetical protein ACQP3C_31380, partial [Escherichia coli]
SRKGRMVAGSALVALDPVLERVIGGVKVGAKSGCLEAAESEEAGAGTVETEEREGSRILVEALEGAAEG